MTGADLCRRLLVRNGIDAEVHRGISNQYFSGDRVVTLHPLCFSGTSPKALTLAVHEAGHAEQESRLGWCAPALRWLVLGRLLLEWDANRRARRMMIAFGEPPDEETLRTLWRAYLSPALWQTGLLAVIGVGAIIWRF